jgi:hypothetical protein
MADTFDADAALVMPVARKPRRRRRRTSVLLTAQTVQSAMAKAAEMPSPRTPRGSRGRHLMRASSFNTQLMESFQSANSGELDKIDLRDRYCTKLEQSSVLDSVAPLARRMFQVIDHSTVPKDSREVLITEAGALYCNLSTEERAYDGEDLQRWLVSTAEMFGAGVGARTVKESQWMKYIDYQASRLPLDILATEMEVFISDLRQASIVMNIQLTFGQEKTIDEVRRNAKTIFAGIETELMPRAIECFKIMDVESDEMITFEEALELYERLGEDAEDAKEEAMEMLESIDSDGSHVISRHDWLLYIEEICDQVSTGIARVPPFACLVWRSSLVARCSTPPPLSPPFPPPLHAACTAHDARPIRRTVRRARLYRHHSPLRRRARAFVAAHRNGSVSCLLCTVIFHANHAHNLTRSP